MTFNRNNDSSLPSLTHIKSDSNLADYDMFCQEAAVSAMPSKAPSRTELHERKKSLTKSDHSGQFKLNKKGSKDKTAGSKKLKKRSSVASDMKPLHSVRASFSKSLVDKSKKI